MVQIQLETGVADFNVAQLATMMEGIDRAVSVLCKEKGWNGVASHTYTTWKCTGYHPRLHIRIVEHGELEVNDLFERSMGALKVRLSTLFGEEHTYRPSISWG